jgi:hypothetical protein
MGFLSYYKPPECHIRINLKQGIVDEIGSKPQNQTTLTPSFEKIDDHPNPHD